MAKQNIDKVPPKGPVRFSISLSEEQKLAKAEIPSEVEEGLCYYQC